MTTTATNFCELFPSDLGKLDTNSVHDRVYIGSYCCCAKFTATIQRMAEILQGRMLTVVIPNVVQNSINDVRDILRKLHDCDDGTTEFVANDIGGLRILNSIGVEKIGAGLFLSKDKRYPAAIREFPTRPKVLSRNCLALLSEFNISAVELEMFQPSLDISGDHRGIHIHMHTPMMHNTNSNICEIGSLSIDDYMRFSPSAPCRFECKNHVVKYIGTRPMYKIGKEVCCESFHNDGIPSGGERIIDRPFFKWLETL